MQPTGISIQCFSLLAHHQAMVLLITPIFLKSTLVEQPLCFKKPVGPQHPGLRRRTTLLRGSACKNASYKGATLPSMRHSGANRTWAMPG